MAVTAHSSEASSLLDAYPWPHQDRMWIRANMVMSLDGVVVDANGRSGSLSTAPDRLLFGNLRRDCDVVLVGAGTVRAERYQPAPWPVALVTNTCELAKDLPLLDPAGGPVMLLTSERGAGLVEPWLRERCEVVAYGVDQVDLEASMLWLARAGLTRIHCEGGTRLLSSLVAEDLIDELLVTVSPQLLGGSADVHLVDVPHVLDPVRIGSFEHVITIDQTVFLRAVLREREALGSVQVDGSEDMDRSAPT
jgi:riboflavin biosynthesis pyrimidine reductase